MKTKDTEVRNLTCGCYGIFENGEFITTGDGFDKMIDQATQIADEGVSTVTIATLNFTGADNSPIIKEGSVIMKFYKLGNTIYITNQLD